MKLVFTKTNKGKDQRIEIETPSIALTENGDVIFIELAGAKAATESVLARIRHISGKVKRNDYEYLGMTVNVGGKDRSLRVQDGKYLDTKTDNNRVIYHTGCGIYRREYFFGGSIEEKSEYFFDAFRINVTGVPATIDMADLLWKHGVQAGLVVPLESYGGVLAMWSLSRRDNLWAEIMSAVIAERNNG